MPWAFLIPAVRYELLQLVIGSIVAMPDKIKFFLRVEEVKHLAEYMVVGGYFSEKYKASAEDLPEIEQRVLNNDGLELTIPFKLKRLSGHSNVIVPEENGMTLKQDAVIRAIRNARTWTDMLFTMQEFNLSDLAKLHKTKCKRKNQEHRIGAQYLNACRRKHGISRRS